MKIDVSTPYSDIAELDRHELLTDKSQNELTKAAEKVFGNPWSLTISQLSDLLSGDFSRLGDLSNPTILQVYWCKRFKSFIEEFSKALENLSLPMDTDEKRATEGLPSVTFIEGLLIFSKNYFHLHSFEQAGRTILSDVLIAKKDVFRTQAQQKKWNNIQQEKMRRHGKHN